MQFSLSLEGNTCFRFHLLGSLQTITSSLIHRVQAKWCQVNHRRFPSEHQDTLFQCEGHRTLLQVAQKGCGVSIFGDTKNTSGHGPA